MGEINWADNPDFIDWARYVRATLVPKLRGADFVMTIVPSGKPDVKFAVELGMSLMLNKPIVLVVRPGTSLPPKLAAVADAIVEWDEDQGVMATKTQAAVERVVPPRPPV